MQVTTATVREPPLTPRQNQGIQGMVVLVTILGLINLDFADVRSFCREAHDAAKIAPITGDPDANIIFGAVIGPDLKEEIRITIIATGFYTMFVTVVSSR